MTPRLHARVLLASVSVACGGADSPRYDPATSVVLERGGENYGYPKPILSGDLNGDGLDDLGVAALGEAGDSSDLSFYLGDPGGVDRSPAAVMSTASTGYAFAYDAAGLGDVTGDGRAELAVVVAYDVDLDQPDEIRRYSVDGALEVATLELLLLPTGIDYVADAKLEGDVDLDGDGVRDLVAALDGWDEVKLATWSGAAGDPASCAWPGESYRMDLGAAGDLTGDGLDEIFTTSEEDLTREVSILTSDGADLEPTPLVSFPIENTGLDGQVAGVGDVDGDGHADLAFIEEADGGTLTLLGGTPAGVELVPMQVMRVSSGSAGYSATLGARPEEGLLAVGLPNEDWYQGATYVFDADGGQMDEQALAIVGGGPHARGFGEAVFLPGDLDGDGWTELVAFAADFQTWGSYVTVVSSSR